MIICTPLVHFSFFLVTRSYLQGGCLFDIGNAIQEVKKLPFFVMQARNAFLLGLIYQEIRVYLTA